MDPETFKFSWQTIFLSSVFIGYFFYARGIKNSSRKEATSNISEIDRFVGVKGSVILGLGLPLVSQTMFALCDTYKCYENELMYMIYTGKADLVEFFKEMFVVEWEAALPFALFWIFAYLIHFFIPGPDFQGWPVTSGQRLTYKLNGLSNLVVSWGVLALAFFIGFNPQHLVHSLTRITLIAQIVAYVITILLYIRGVLRGSKENSGNVIVDLFYGYEQNPRLFEKKENDLKFFIESRALICWSLIDWMILYTQYIEIGSVSNSMILSVMLQQVYVLHALYHESNLLSMVDFTAENFGWMLCWGNIVWVGFVFCLPTLFCYYNTFDVSWPYFIFVTALFFFGRSLFGQANLQKHQFKTNPNALIWGKKPEIIKGKGQQQLLVSGWWGIARKVNYTGDLVMAVSFGLVAHDVCVVPFLYALYLTMLLIHRQHRDDEWCHGKYGDAWLQYRKRVPYRLIPYVY